MNNYLQADQVLAQVEDLIRVNKEEEGLEQIYNFLYAKRSKHWCHSLETLMKHHINFSLKYEKNQYIKEGLTAFRNITQTSNVSSLETILKYYLETVERQFDESVKDVENQANYLRMIEEEDNPEDLYLNVLDTALDINKKDRVRKKWRILIDAFRTELELIYRNKKLEDIYCLFGKRAFQKCLKFRKSLEFKRLSEVVKNHQWHNIKAVERSAVGQVVFALDMKNPDTNEKLVDFRFTQLEYAKELGLWHDSYKIIEDINTLMKSKKNVGVKTLIPYYDNLHQIFWHAKEYLFHAVAYQSYYACLKVSGKDSETIRDASSLLVLSVLSIPKNPKEHSQSTDVFAKNCRLLSSNGVIHTKENLIQMIKTGSYLDLCHKDVRDLFFLMSESKNMLTFSKQAEKIFKKLKSNDDHTKFLPLISENLIIQLLKQISQLYKKITFDRFKAILGFFDFGTCEKMILYNNVSDNTRIRIDYDKKNFLFEHHNTINLSGNNGIIGLARAAEIMNNTLRQEDLASTGQWVENFGSLLDEAREFLGNAEATMAERDDLLRNAASMVAEAPKEEQMTKPDEEAQEAARRKVSDERKVSKKNEQINQIKKERIQEILKKNKASEIRLRKKKLKDYTDAEIEFIEMEDLIELDKEIEQAERDQKRKVIVKAFKKIDYIERENRKKENEHIRRFYEANTIDVETLRVKAQEIHDKNVERKARIIDAKTVKEDYVQEKLISKQETYAKEIVEFKQRIAEDYRQKIIEKAIDRATKAKLERDELETEQRKHQEIRNAREQKIMADRVGRGDTFSGDTGLAQRGENFKAKSDLEKKAEDSSFKKPMPATALVGRGTGITEKVASAWTDKPIEKREDKPVATAMVGRGTGIAERNSAMAEKQQSGMGGGMGGGLSRGTDSGMGGGLSRGTGTTGGFTGSGKGTLGMMGDPKPSGGMGGGFKGSLAPGGQDPPKPAGGLGGGLQRGAGVRGAGLKKPEEEKKKEAPSNTGASGLLSRRR